LVNSLIVYCKLWKCFALGSAAFPKGNPYLPLRDTLGTIFHDADGAALFPATGQPSLPPWRLAPVTILPLRENLPDRQAAEAVRARIDGKSLLSLALTAPGFDNAVWCELRARGVSGNGAEMVLDKGLECCRTCDWLKTRGTQRTDAPQVVAAIRVLNRLA